MPKVSVIVPVYNVEQYLERCLESIVNQTLEDIEIILVNDGSKDGSIKICEKYAQNDSRIKIVTRKNGGLAAARNTGLKHATGEYIGFIDSDDWIDLDYYEKLYNTAKKHDSDIAYTDFIRKGKNKHKKRMNFTDEVVSTEILDKIKKCKNLTLGCVWNKIYRKELIFNNNLSFPEGHVYEDGLFTMKSLYYANSVVSVPNTYYYYFVNPTSIVKSARTQSKIDDKMICRCNILNFLQEKGINIEPDAFLAVKYKVKLWGLTLWVIKEDQYSIKHMLFGSIPVLSIQKKTNDRYIGKFLGIKFSIRKKQLSDRKIAELNKPYENGEAKTPNVIDAEGTLKELIKTNKSICRFGDGEFSLIFGESIPFQNYSQNLENRLKEVLSSKNENLMVGIPNIFGSLEDIRLKKTKNFWRKYVVYNREKLYSYLNLSKKYYDAMVSRPYFNVAGGDRKQKFDEYKEVWADKDIVFVEGEGSRLGFGNDLFSNVKSIQRILCPSKNAFDKYDEILKTCLEIGKEKLFILALGPTATVLAYDLTQNGYRALDLGHLDIEYEWFLMGVKKKVPIKDKYVNETRNGKKITEINDPKYLNEIYKKVI